MIPLGGPPLCAVCRTVEHAPTPECPEPYVCLTGDNCPACAAREIPSS